MMYVTGTVFCTFSMVNNSSDQFGKYPFSNVPFILLILTLSPTLNLGFLLGITMVLFIMFCKTLASFSFRLASVGVIPIVDCFTILFNASNVVFIVLSFNGILQAYLLNTSITLSMYLKPLFCVLHSCISTRSQPHTSSIL